MFPSYWIVDPSGSSGNASSNSDKVSSSDGNDDQSMPNNTSGNEDQNDDSAIKTSDATSIKDSDSQENIPLSLLKEQIDDDLPLSVLKKNLAVEGKPIFKTKSYELFKYKSIKYL